MCGISGIISFKTLKGNDLKRARKLSRSLLLGIETRGTDATGTAVFNFKKDTYSIFKKDKPATEYIKERGFNDLFKNDLNAVILHTRATTTGTERENVNNHPHLNKVTQNVLIHNGVISNHKELKEKYKLKLDGECDSEVILKLIDKTGYKKAFDELRGSFAVCFSNHKQKTLNLYRSTSPLFMAYLDKEGLFIFASEKWIIDHAIGKYDVKTFGKLEFEKVIGGYYLKEFEDGDFMTFDFKNNGIRFKELKETKTYYYGSYNEIEKDISNKTKDDGDDFKEYVFRDDGVYQYDENGYLKKCEYDYYR